MSLADNYPPMDADDCTSLGLGGWCNQTCPKGQEGRCPQGFFDADGNYAADED